MAADAVLPDIDPRFRSTSIPTHARTANKPDDHWSDIGTLDVAAGPGGEHPGVEKPAMADASNPSILTRKTDPFLPARVDAIMAELKIGADLNPTEHARVEEVLRSFADCFALSMSEVIAVEGAEHKLNIPKRDSAKFRTNPHQRPLSTPQRIYLNNAIDKMLQADVIAPIDHRDVKCCGATTLAKKAHDGTGLTLDQLQHQVNDECIANGFPAAFVDPPPRTSSQQTRRSRADKMAHLPGVQRPE